ncbi:MAG: hypothetical protein QG614_347 [Patescibacteria group bacterium]|nr:hypothetical protein [Patescibacteria group bacterium]
MSFLSPKQMIDQMYIQPNSTILDIGAGSGAYIYEVCRVNGKGGKVVAVDIDADKLKLVKDTASIGGYDIDILNVDIESGILLPDYMADYIVMANTFYQIDKSKRQTVLKDISRLLAPMGEMLFVEWKEKSVLGPSEELIVDRVLVEELFKECNLKIKKELSAGDYHYAYLLTK